MSEKVCHWRWTLRFQRLTLFQAPCLCFTLAVQVAHSQLFLLLCLVPAAILCSCDDNGLLHLWNYKLQFSVVTVFYHYNRKVNTMEVGNR